jgi:hypothetical protein
MIVKTSELTDITLDWAVAKCRGLTPFLYKNQYGYWVMSNIEGSYSSEWLHGGPIIEQEEIGIQRNAPCSDGRQWEARSSITAKGAGGRWGYGPTPLIAAMRCFVASRLGDEVDVPEELLQ